MSSHTAQSTVEKMDSIVREQGIHANPFTDLRNSLMPVVFLCLFVFDTSNRYLITMNMKQNSVVQNNNILNLKVFCIQVVYS